MSGSHRTARQHAECEHPKGGTPQGTRAIPKIVPPEVTHCLLETNEVPEPEVRSPLQVHARTAPIMDQSAPPLRHFRSDSPQPVGPQAALIPNHVRHRLGSLFPAFIVRLVRM